MTAFLFILISLVLLYFFLSSLIYLNSNVFAIGTSIVDRFGIIQIYPTKLAGEQWFMNMTDPNHDIQTFPPLLTKNADGSWKANSSKVRYDVYTSAGFHPKLITTLNETVLQSKGYMQSPNDWKNIEMTGIVKFNSGDYTNHWTWYARGGVHTLSIPCEGTSYKEGLNYDGKNVKIAKEQWHVLYVFSKSNSTSISISSLGKFIGFKAIMYNFVLNNKTAVKLEMWLDTNLNNNWQRVFSFTDSGGFGNSAKRCGGAPDQIITWGGPVATFRWDNAKEVDIKNFSIREIQPPPLPPI